MHEPHGTLEASSKAPSGVTVYAVQENPNVNLLPATAYGQVVIMLPGGFRATYAAQPAARKLRALMRGISRSDLLLPVGDPAAIALAAAIMTDLTGGWLNILKWDNQEKCYYPVRIDVFDRFPGELRQIAS